MQGVLARGDRRLAPVLLDLPRPTVRGFRDALARHGLTAEEYLGERGQNDFMPWDVIESGVKTELPALRAADCPSVRNRATAARPAPCDCLACGVCVPEAGTLERPDDSVRSHSTCSQLPVSS